MRRWAVRTHLVGLLVALTACGRPAPPPSGAGGAPLTVVDDAGRSVTLPAPARRVVSLLPSFTEILFALGAGDRIVGRTTWCDYPPATRAIPSVGDAIPPNVEAVAARRPDLVVLYKSPVNQTATTQLTRLGITVVVVRLDQLEDVSRAARLLGRLTGRETPAESLAAVMDSLAPQPRVPRPRSLAFVVWDNPPIVIGAGSYLDRLAVLAGARNVFHDLSAPSAQVSIEAIAARDPDLIVVLADTARPPAFATRREWRTIRAVQQDRFLYLPGTLFGRPGPRAALAVREFHRLLEAAP